MLALRHPRFRTAHVHDQVRPFRALHDHRHQFARAGVIFVVNRVALGLAHLLQDHLLGRLRRDAPEHIGRLRGQNFRPDFRVWVLLLRVRQADFPLRVDNLFHHRLHRIHVHLPGFRIELSAQILFGLVKLARGHHHRIFDGRDHHFRFDVLFPAQHLDLLIEQIRHFSSLKSPTSFTFRLVTAVILRLSDQDSRRISTKALSPNSSRKKRTL